MLRFTVVKLFWSPLLAGLAELEASVRLDVWFAKETALGMVDCGLA